MPEIVTHSADNPEFARVVDIARLRGRAEFAFDLGPTPEEAAALARLMGARSLRKLRFHGRLAAAPQGAWRLEAELGATVVQSCVVTLEPVVTRVDAPVRRLFSPQEGASPAEIVVGAADDDDETEPLGERIDLGLVATEALALALPDYPRREGASLSQPAGAEAGSPPPEAGIRPFAALATLRDKMGEGS